MKVSLNWIRELSGVALKDDELLDKIGLRLGAVDSVEAIGAAYQGITIVKVVECIKHPDADKLRVCKVDDKGVVKGVKRDAQSLVQVVCGAPNVRAGMLVAWIPPGATVPSTFSKDPFVIEAKELRGVMSSGMLASAKELAIGDGHEGLLELDGSAKAGADFAKTYELDDQIIDIENKMFTHRPDCFGQLGVAREVAGITHKKIVSPGWYKPDVKLASGRSSLKLEVKNQLPKLVPRFSAVVIENVEVKPSPVWLQAALAKLGVKPINNLVDLTNYMMLLSAQPLHAYDYDKVTSGTLGIRLSKAGESLELLGGKTIKLKAGVVVITDGQKPIGLGGVMGGATTEVGADTKNIILECAAFDAGATRKTAYELGLFTEAATRFTKNQSPLQNMTVLARTAELIHQLAGGTIGKVQDEQSLSAKPSVVKTNSNFINSRLGLKLSAVEMKRLLSNVEFGLGGSSDELNVEPPFWRTDIAIAEDVVEEVGRLYGYEHLPLALPKRDIAPVRLNSSIELKNKLRNTLSRAGGNEALTYSFVPESLLLKVGQDPKHAYKIANALSPDLQYYRLSLMPSLLEKVNQNIRAGFGELAIFEINRVHYVGEMDVNEPKIPNEDNHIALVVAYDSKHQPPGSPYYYAKRYLSEIVDLQSFKLVPLNEFDLSKDEWGRQLTSSYEPTRSAVIVVDAQIWGVVGEFNSSVRQALKLPVFASGFEVHLDIANRSHQVYQPINRFPEVEQDFCLRAPAKMTYEELAGFIEANLGKLAAHYGTTYTIQPVDIFQRKDDTTTKQTTWHITLFHPDRTLTTQETNQLLDELALLAKKELKAERI